MLTQKMTILDKCWVCERKFDHSTKQEDHHVIPRAYGGVDGPQVSLCDSHHSALHEIAGRLYSKRSYFNLLTGDTQQDKKLMYLASCVYNARVLTENDPNKRRILVLSPSKETIEKLDRLKGLFRGNVSREKVIEAAVDALYKRHFIN
jgi:hypothetical protein